MCNDFIRRHGAPKSLHGTSHCGLNLNPTGSRANIDVVFAAEAGDNAHRR
jgi:hypothetical protein